MKWGDVFVFPPVDVLIVFHIPRSSQTRPHNTCTTVQVDDVTSARERVPLWGGSYIYTFGKYTVSLTRYHSYYLTSAVVPAIIIASLVLSSLWMESHANRLSMGITGFLTMTAIQVCVKAVLGCVSHVSFSCPRSGQLRPSSPSRTLPTGSRASSLPVPHLLPCVACSVWPLTSWSPANILTPPLDGS